MTEQILQDLRSELRRVVGAAGVDVVLEDRDDLGTAARVETADHVAHADPHELLAVLQELPDNSGPLALRESMEQNIRKGASS